MCPVQGSLFGQTIPTFPFPFSFFFFFFFLKAVGTLPVQPPNNGVNQGIQGEAEWQPFWVVILPLSPFFLSILLVAHASRPVFGDG